METTCVGIGFQELILLIMQDLVTRHMHHCTKNGFAHHNFWGFIQQESTAFRKNFFIKHGHFLKYENNACDYHLWKKFSKVSKLESFSEIGNIQALRFEEQNSKIQEKKYFSDTGIKKYFFSFNVYLDLLFLCLCCLIFI